MSSVHLAALGGAAQDARIKIDDNKWDTVHMHPKRIGQDDVAMIL
jgi:hypothetical protein